MKKLLLTLSILALLQVTFAQQWKSKLPAKKDGNYTLFDYQKAFKNYCKTYKKPAKGMADPENSEFGIPGYSQFKRWEWYWTPRVDQKTGEFPKKSAWEVWQDYKTVNNIKSTGGTWINRGDAILDPIDGGSIQESGTGRLNCALFVPGDNNHYFIGAAAGGLWETTDNGTSWTCLTDNNPILGVSDIAIPPDYNKTTNPTIYIASGDRDAGDDPSIGVLKTTDGGATWSQTGLDFHDKSGVQIGRLIINPDDKNIMWAATSIGVYKSTDQGANWTFVQGGNFIDMELLPGSTSPGNGTLIATTNGWSPKVYRTTDGGLTWTNTWTSPTTDEYRCDVAVTPAASNNVYIITADGTNSMAFHGLYVSTDGGVSFTQKYAGTTNNLYGWGANNAMSAGGQGWYDATLAVSNTNANVIYIAGVNGFVSTNGGTSFTICNAWDSGNGADVIHADHHNAYFRLSDNRLFDVNDGGFYYCDNVTSGGSSNWFAKTDGLVTGQLYDIGIAQTKNNEIISGFQDNGTKLCKVSTTDFDQVIGGDGMCCAINPTNNSIQYGTYAQMRVYKSTNEGASFSIIRNSGSADWAGPVEADPQGGEVYIADDRVKQYRGTSTLWDNLSQSLDATNYLKVLAVFNDGTNKMIWTAGTSGCWKSPLGGGSGSGYTAISGLPADMVTDIDIDDDDYNHVYVCFGGYDNYNVYETTDGGSNWTDISAGLPAVPCGAIVINEQNTTKNEVYVGTDAGIYVKLGNAPWQLFNDGMPFVSITDLEIYYNTTPANTRIYASTYGRGVWSSDCYEPPTLDAAISYISVPADEYCSLGNITPTVELGNIGTTTLTSATISYTIDGGAPVTQNWTSSLAQGATTNITFPSIALSYGAHDFVATVSNPNGGSDVNSANDSKSKTFSVWNNDVPYTQSFDNFSPNIGYDGTSVVLEECWSNDGSESSLDWSVTQGETPSGSTGPSGDHTSGNGRYLYTEVSGISTATSVNLLSPTFDLTNYTSNQISFWYQMNGANCGSLQIDLYYAGTWHNGISAAWDGVTATSVSGNKGATWYQVTADISAADGDNNVQVRIASTTGTAYDGDIAIDDFNITGVSACTQPATQASNITFSGITNNSITASWTSGSGDAEIVVVREGSAVNQDPTSGNTYTANATFASGSQIGVGNYVVYDGTAGSVAVTGLTPGTAYYFAVYTYNSADHCYNITELAGNTTTLGPPSVTTTAASGITGNSANSGGNVTSDNGAAVTARGVCWNTTGTPTTADSKTTDGSGTGAFVSSLTGLSAVTTYYVRAYATNSYGTSYGNEETFTTSCGIISSFPYTQDFDSWTTSSPAVACTADGSVPLEECWTNVIEGGIDWDIFTGATGSSSTGPSADHTTGSGNYLYTESSGTCQGIGYITSPSFDFSGLSDATLTFYYHMYGSTMQPMSVQISTDGGSNWSGNVWSLSGDQGNAWIQATVDLTAYAGQGNIVIRWTGDLSGNTGYRSDMAIDDINVDGTAGTPPTVTTQAVSNISCTTATGNGNITDLGTPNPTDHGVCWNTTGTPTTATSHTDEGGASATGAFTSSMTGLTEGTTYYVRAYVTNAAGTSYGSEVSFTTDPLPTAPTSVSASPTSVSSGGSSTLSYTGGSGTTFVWYTGSCGGTQIGTGQNLSVTNITVTTTYYGRWENACGNSSCQSVTVNVTAAAPTISSVNPTSFFADKGATLTVNGSGLGGSTVTLGGITGTITSNDGSTLVVDFPAGHYTNSTLTVSTGVNPDATSTVTVNTRNVIPVGGGTDFHTTIQSALDGLFAWFGTNAFSTGTTGYLAGTKIIDVYNGIYTEKVTPNVTLGTTASENLIIQNHTGETPAVNAFGLTNAFYIGALDYVQILGFTAYNSTDAVIYTEGDNNLIQYNKCYGSTAGAGIILNTSLNSTVQNNLLYNNYTYGLRLIVSNNAIIKNNTIANNGNEAKAPPLPGVYTPAQLYVESGTGVSIENNILYAKTGSNIFTLLTENGITVSSDYNTYYKNGNTNLVYYNGTVYADIAAWAGNGSGANDLEGDPLFVNAGTDFHIQSANGSYPYPAEWPPATAPNAWNNDASTSPALDTGNPADAFANEPVSGSRINQGAYGNTAQASKSTGINWNGSVSIDWQTAANWTPAQVPTALNDIVIPNGMPNYPVVDDNSTTAVCNNMTIENAASVEIADNGQMTVSGSITNNRGAAGLIVRSNGSGDGSLIVNNSPEATAERFVTGNQWHMMFPTLDAIPTSTYTTEGSDVNNNFYSYNESNEDYWDAASLYNISGWTSEVGATNIRTDKGYLFNRYNLGDKTFVQTGGNIYSADKVFNVDYTISTVTIANGVTQSRDYFDGWNLTGNPYTCAVDWNSVTYNGIENGVYYFDGTNYQYYINGGGSAPYDIGITLNGGSQYIPSGQGFMVKVINTSTTHNTTFTIPAAARVHNSQTFWKQSSVTIPDLIKINIEKDGFTDEMIVRTLPAEFDVTDGHDAKFDVYKMFSWDNTKPQLYSYDNNNSVYAINSIPKFTGNKVVPLAIYIGISGIYHINSTVNNFEGYNIYLHDILKDTYLQMNSGASYFFDSDQGTILNRFELVFEKSNSGISGNTINTVHLYPNPTKGSFYLSVDNTVNNFRVEITNVTGQLIYQNKFFGKGTNEINLDNVSNGIYFVKVIFNNNKTVNKKIVIE